MIMISVHKFYFVLVHNNLNNKQFKQMYQKNDQIKSTKKRALASTCYSIY